MQLATLDLNLLRTLDALLREASVTRAAKRLGVSQPAVSMALARLRRHFEDDLLRRVGNRYELTPLAVQLKDRTGLALLGVRRVFESQPAFDPASEQREFTVLTSDYAMARIGEALREVITDQAPHVLLRLRQHTPADIAQAEETARAVDGIVIPHGFVSDLRHTDLYEDGWTCLVATSNTRVGEELTMDLLRELPWAFTYLDPAAFTPAQRQLQMLGIQARVQVVVESFLALPFVVAGTDRVALVQSGLADRLTAAGDVRSLPCPFDAQRISEAFWWHPMHERDPGHRWLREQLAAAFATAPAAG